MGDGGDHHLRCDGNAENALAMPSCIASHVDGYRQERYQTGCAGATVLRLKERTPDPEMFLKFGSGSVADDITDEMVRLRWLSPNIRVPAFVRFVAGPKASWLLTEALPGRTVRVALETDPDAQSHVVGAVAHFVSALHSLPARACPFEAGDGFRLSQARARIDAGLIDVEDFDEDHMGWSAEDVWQALISSPGRTPDRVVTHGDLTLDNLLIDDNGTIGCIDVGRAGVADRYQDLTLLLRDLDELGDGASAQFARHYKINHLDTGKLAFYRLLDELF